MTILSYLVALAVGIFFGYILFKMLRIGACILAAIGGAFIGMAVYELILYSTKSFVALVIVTILFALIMAFFSFKYYHQIIILGTAIIGAYCFIRGVSVFAGSFPNEYLMLQKLANGIVLDLPYQFYIYMSAILVLFGMGAAFQFKSKQKEENAGFQKVN